MSRTVTVIYIYIYFLCQLCYCCCFGLSFLLCVAAFECFSGIGHFKINARTCKVTCNNKHTKLLKKLVSRIQQYKIMSSLRNAQLAKHRSNFAFIYNLYIKKHKLPLLINIYSFSCSPITPNSKNSKIRYRKIYGKSKHRETVLVPAINVEEGAV